MPGVGTQPYDTAEYVLNLTRSLGNDAIQSLAGSLLSDSQPYVVPFLNSAYRYVQRRMANAGVQTFKKRTILTSFPAVASIDPGVNCQLSYTGYFNGTSNFATPTLPADLCWPLKLRERQTGTKNPYRDMFPARDGLQSRPQGIFFCDWIYQQDMILLNGATLVNDIELMYVPFLPDIQVGNLSQQQILIVRSANTLAAFTLAEFAGARGSPLVDSIRQIGEQYLRDMISSDAMMKQRGNYRRQPYSRRVHAGWSWY